MTATPPATAAAAAATQDALLAKIDPLVLEEVAAEGETEFFVWMTAKADLSPSRSLQSKLEKGQFVFDTLRATAESSQRELRALLDAQGIDYRPFYIANKIFVFSGGESLLSSLVARPDVERITPNRQFQLEEPFVDPPPPGEILAIEPNISFIRVPEVWDMGFRGEGMVLAGGDTGLIWDHPAIIGQYRGWDGTDVDHNYNWWDATGTYPNVPGDGNGHGTHTTGTMVGDDGGTNQIGVAPGAKTIHCKNITDGGSGNDFTFSTCFEWQLAPWDLSGDNPRPDLAPHAINNSWGYFGGGQPQFMQVIDALQAAGILVEVSAGNEGPSCGTLRSPGDYAQVLTTGSVSHAGGVLPGTLTGFSSRGPSSLFPGELIPGIMAPGESVRSSVPGGGYQFFSGTSMSGPHTTALIALMWQAAPSFEGLVEDTNDIIYLTAVPLSGQTGSNCGGDYDVGPNNDWGFGTVDALEAVEEAMALEGDSGFVAGTVTDVDFGNPIAGATVSTDIRSVRTNADGEYSMRLPVGTYEVTASAENYMSVTVSDVVVELDQTTTVDFALQGSSLFYSPDSIEESMQIGDVVSNTVTVSNTGPLPIDFSVRIRDFAGPDGAAPPRLSLPPSDGNFPRGEAPHSVLAPPADGGPALGAVPEQPALELLVGSTAYSQNDAGLYYTVFDLEVPEVLPNVAPFSTGAFIGAGEFVDGSVYMVDGNHVMHEVDPESGTLIGTTPVTAPPGGHSYTGMALDPTSGEVYLTSCDITTTQLYLLDVPSGAATTIGTVTNSPCTIAIAIDGSGQMYGHDIINDSLLRIDKSTAAGEIIGSLGFDANFGQGMAWDPATDTLLLAAFNGGTFQAELRAADRDTGNTVLVGVLGQQDPGGTNQLGYLAVELSTTPPWAFADPDSGTVQPGEEITFEVIFDATSLIEVGTFTANLEFSGTFVNDPPLLPLTMHLACDTCGFLEGEIFDAFTNDPLTANIHITSANGFDVTLSGDSYGLAVQPGTYDFVVSANGYFEDTASVEVIAGETTVTDFHLVPMVAFLEYSPDFIEEAMEVGQIVSNTVTVSNPGTVPLEFNVRIRDFAGPTASDPVQITVPAGAQSGPAEGTAAASSPRPPGDLPASAFTYTDTGGLLQATTVLIVHADDGDGEPLRSILLDYPDIAAVDVWDARANGQGVPPLDVLEAYEILITWSNFPYADRIAMGDVLADYVDGGGLVIQAVFNWIDNSTWGLGGRFVTEGYSPFVNIAGGNHFNFSNLGDFDAGHPIMDGVTEASDFFRDIVNLDPDADLVASWADGEEFVATKDSVVAINSYPGISRQWTGDVGIIFHNAVNFLLAGTGVQWAHADPDSGTVEPGEELTFQVIFDATSLSQEGTYTANLGFTGNFSNDPSPMPLTMHLECPTCGFLDGEIFDAFTNDPLSATISFEGVQGFNITVSGDSYSVSVPADTYTITVEANGYFSDSATVEVATGETVTTDFSLVPMVAFLEYSPDFIEEAMEVGQIVSNTVTVSNPGTIPLDFSVRIRDFAGPDGAAPPRLSLPPSDGSFPRGEGPPSVLEPPADGGPVPGAVPDEPGFSLQVGTTAYSQNAAGLYYTVFDLEVPEVLPNVAPFDTGAFIGAGELVDGSVYMVDGNHVMHEVDPETGALIGTTPVTAPPGGHSYTGMALDPTSGEVYLTSCDITTTQLYLLDVPSGAATTIGTVTNSPCTIAIAIDGSGQMYGHDIINDSLLRIDKSTAAGEIIGSLGFDANFGQGMAWDPATDTLLLAAFNAGTFQAELRAADRDTGNTVLVGVLGQQDPGGTNQLGYMAVELSTTPPWAFADPDSGTVQPGEEFTFEVIFDATSLSQEGTYTANLGFTGNFSNDPSSMPLTMHLECPTCGFLDGEIFDAFTNDPLSATISIEGVQGFNITVSGDSYSVSVPADTYTITVEANGYFSDSATVEVTTGETVTTDFSLVPMVAFLEYSPGFIEETVQFGDMVSNTVTVTNPGTIPLQFTVSIGGFAGPTGGLDPAPHLVSPTEADFSQPAPVGPMSVRSAEGSAVLGESGTPLVWIDAAPIPVGLVRYGHAQCEDAPDSFYLISGVSNGTIISDVRRYDAATDTWSSLAPIPLSAEGPSAVCYEGHIYVAGGNGTNQFFVYDIANDSWSAGPAVPRNVLGAAMGAWEGRVYVIGGDDDFSPGNGLSDEVNIYDIGSGTWSLGTPMPVAAVFAGSGQAGEHVYAVGGWGLATPGSNVDATQRYDMSSDTWETGPTFTSARSDFALAITDDNLYAIGGDANGGGFFDASALVESLDHSAWPGGSWIDIQDPIPTALTAFNGGFCTGAVTGGEIWAPGGLDSSFIWHNQNRYRPAEACFAGSARWAHADPASGTVEPGEELTFEVIFDSSVVEELGTHTANLRFLGNFSNDPPAMPLTMHVEMDGVEIVLEAAGRRVQGMHVVDLSWEGATSAEIDVIRDGALITTVPNSGFHTDHTGRRGRATYVYQVCEAGTSTCSNEVTVRFGGPGGA